MLANSLEVLSVLVRALEKIQIHFQIPILFFFSNYLQIFVPTTTNEGGKIPWGKVKVDKNTSFVKQCDQSDVIVGIDAGSIDGHSDGQ